MAVHEHRATQVIGVGSPTVKPHRSRRPLLAAIGGIALVLAVVVGSALANQLSLWNTAASASPRVATPGARLTTVAEFPVGTFLEDLVVREDGSMLITDLHKKQLWYLPAPTPGALAEPRLVYTFDAPPFDIQEGERDVFYVDAANYLTSHDSFLYRVDLRGWQPGMPAPVSNILKFPFPVTSANGSSFLAPDVLLVADSMLGLIWRVDLSDGGTKASASVWLRDPTMSPNPITYFGQHKVQPGVNGLEYATKTHYLYYTASATRMFMRVRVDPETLRPVGSPERVASGYQWDDFDIDENAGVAYITTHRDNSIERVPLDPSGGQSAETVAGRPFNPLLAGPSDFAWGPNASDYGSVAYMTSDGGYTAPPADGIVRTAKVLRVDLAG